MLSAGQYFKWVGQSPEWVGHGLPGLGLEPPLPRTSQSSTMPETIPETQETSQEDYEVIIPCRRSGFDSRPYPVLVDPNATTLPLQSTPLVESSGIRDILFLLSLADHHLLRKH